MSPKQKADLIICIFLVIIFTAGATLLFGGVWKFLKTITILIIIVIVYFGVIAPALMKSKYKVARRTYDMNIKSRKISVGIIGTDYTRETIERIQKEYVVDPKTLFHNTPQGKSMFREVKWFCGYPKGAIPDLDDYSKDYVVGEVVEMQDTNPKYKNYQIIYNNLVYNVDGSYYNLGCIGNRLPTVENVKKYGCGGTHVEEYGINKYRIKKDIKELGFDDDERRINSYKRKRRKFDSTSGFELKIMLLYRNYTKPADNVPFLFRYNNNPEGKSQFKFMKIHLIIPKERYQIQIIMIRTMQLVT
ncbi:MAG: hypothetical protein R3Y24_13740 [Eubacteriales bacterium]